SRGIRPYPRGGKGRMPRLAEKGDSAKRLDGQGSQWPWATVIGRSFSDLPVDA
ncbi:MAG: hypothetical protein QOI14_1468, partial [Actinomycetota bacterium]|nr:hypothetical protein [Actinomycetota bacterium]